MQCDSPRLWEINPYGIIVNCTSILCGFIEQDVGPHNVGPGLSSGGFEVGVFEGFGSFRPNIRNSCPKLGKADVSDVPGFTSCLTCPECRGIVMSIGENFFWKLLNVRGSSRSSSAHYFQVFLEMAENQPENQEAAVPATGAAQMTRELSPIYRWVSRNVLGAPSILSQAYLDEMKLSGVIFGGGDLEGRYRVEAARPWDRVCYLNLDHPTVPNWLWVNEVMFTEFGVRVPFTDFQERLLNRASVAPSQLHPNAWSAIRCFELVTDSLKLPQDPEVFLYLFTLFSPNTEGKTKKGYMSVRPGKYRKIFSLFEDSFHDFKGRFFRIFPVGEHCPFWLSLEGQGQFPPYWSRDTGMDYVPVTYKGLNADQKDTASLLIDMAGKEVTLERLCRLIRPGSSQSVPAVSVPAPGISKLPIEPQPISASGNVAFPEGGGSSNVGGAEGPTHEVSSPVLDKTLPSSPSSPQVHLGQRPADDATAEPKRPRVSDGTNREFCSMDHSFDASLLGPRA
ncbi:hypothetical protein PIB30_053395 [Stylosanthes scabra]|uniref:Transposase (putative) gypsy type domain-containing protein n=1 Tax=Stylosanthes scabra TaxID=79078 RepID=A0ABU6UIC8_9FABA|nr:hypothetical protein [Stylosanthes scabra]